MALPTNRNEFKQYVRRRLGEPVITLNVSDDQLEERIDDALAFFQDYHFHGSERIYLKHILTASNLVFQTTSTGMFTNNEVIRGETSNTFGKVYRQSVNTAMEFTYRRVSSEIDPEFVPGETIRGVISNATAVVSSVTKGDWDLQYIPVSPLVLSINKVLPLDGFAVDRSTGLFSWNYQFLMNDLSWLSSSSVISYFLTRSHMELLNDLLIGGYNVRYNRLSHRMYLDIDWNVKLKPGDFIVVDAFRVLDPATFSDIWTDRFLRDYATALVKRQWGLNLSKYNGVQLPGNVTLNGQEMYTAADQEIQKIEEQIQLKYELPPEFFVA